LPFYLLWAVCHSQTVKLLEILFAVITIWLIVNTKVLCFTVAVIYAHAATTDIAPLLATG